MSAFFLFLKELHIFGGTSLGLVGLLCQLLHGSYNLFIWSIIEKQTFGLFTLFSNAQIPIKTKESSNLHKAILKLCCHHIYTWMWWLRKGNSRGMTRVKPHAWVTRINTTGQRLSPLTRHAHLRSARLSGRRQLHIYQMRREAGDAGSVPPSAKRDWCLFNLFWS